MKLTLRFFFTFIAFAGLLFASRASDISSGVKDAVVVDAINRFRAYFNAHDSTSLKSWVVSQAYYDQLLADLQEKEVTCLTKFDLSYSTRQVVDEFNKAWQSVAEYRLDSIALVQVSQLEGCGGITYKKIDSRAYFRQGNAPFVELPLTLVLLADGNKNFQLMMQIVNYKILQHEQ